MKNLNNNKLHGLKFENEFLKTKNKELRRENRILGVSLCVSNLLFLAYIIITQIL